MMWRDSSAYRDYAKITTTPGPLIRVYVKDCWKFKDSVFATHEQKTFGGDRLIKAGTVEFKNGSERKFVCFDSIEEAFRYAEVLTRLEHS